VLSALREMDEAFMKTTKRLVINADDFGLTRGVSLAIAELMTNGKVSSATAMMCVPGSPDLQSEIRGDIRSSRLGVHLQLTGGVALTRSVDGLLVDAETGAFGHKSRFGALSPVAVYDEWKAQVELFESLYGHKPSHLDTHHGAHGNANLSAVYVQLAQEFGIGARGGAEHINAELTRAGIPHPDAIYGEWTGRGLPLAELLRALEVLVSVADFSCIEVETHPGFADEELNQVSSLNVRRGLEFEQLQLLEYSHLQTLGVSLAEYPSGRSS
jgi:predicted glycoside hydrolase/deacetylase ChbG (UPF0249 family)